MLGLRKIKTDADFKWPLEVGTEVIAPDAAVDFNPVAHQKGGFLILPNAQGDYIFLKGDLWAVVEFNESDVVYLSEDAIKVSKCKIVHISEKSDGLLEYFKNVEFDSRSAYYWATFIGDAEHMRKFITESEWAYHWAKNAYPDDKEHMLKFIKEPQWAYLWAYQTSDASEIEHMKQFVTSSEYAFWWAFTIGDKEHMRQFVNQSDHAYWWACTLGDVEHMRQFISNSQFAYQWAMNVGDVDYMRQFVTESCWAYHWIEDIGDAEEMLPFVTDAYYKQLLNAKFQW
jgi:hypothetical protein